MQARAGVVSGTKLGWACELTTAKKKSDREKSLYEMTVVVAC